MRGPRMKERPETWSERLSALRYIPRLGKLIWQTFNVGAEYMLMGSNGSGTYGFQTPLATKHAFNGWADMFLTTPVNGLKDFYVQAGYSLPADMLGLKSVNPALIYHAYATDVSNAGIGAEWDAQAELVADGNLSFLLKYADYQGSGVAIGGFADKRIVWLQTAWKY